MTDAIRMPTWCPCDGDRCRLTVDDPHHGTATGYQTWYCRCQPCRDAHYEARLSYMEQRADEGAACPNCGGPPGLYREGTCDACAGYARRHGRPRPRHLYDRTERHCHNCRKRMLVGTKRRQGRCDACYHYWRRQKVERPAELWRPLEVDAADDVHLDQTAGRR